MTANRPISFGDGGAGGAAGDTRIVTTTDGPIAFDSTTDNTYSGVISGAGGLIKDNVNTLTLTGQASHTGSTVINDGVLSIAGTLSLGRGAILNNADLRFEGAVDQRLHNVISGAGSITKNSSATLTLFGNNTYSGATLINAGKLVGVTGGACRNSSLRVGDGATNRVDVLSSGDEWSCAGLEYTGDSATLEFDFFASPASTATAPLRVNGDLSLAGNVALWVKNGIWLSTGTFPLISYTGSRSGPGALIIADLPNGVSAALVNNTAAKQIELQVTEISSTVTPGAISTWQHLDGGNASGDWNTAGNWLNGVAAGVDAVADFSALELTSDSSVAINTPRTVGTLLFNDVSPSHDWYLANATLTLAASTGMPVIRVTANKAEFHAGLAGGQGFRKEGSGMLRLYGLEQNTLGGTVLVEEGTLAVYKGASLQNSTCAIAVAAGACLDFENEWDGVAVANTLYLNGNGIGDRGALHVWENQHITGEVNLLSDSRITFQDQCAFIGPIIAAGTGKNLELNQPNLNQPEYDLMVRGGLSLGTGVLTLSSDVPRCGKQSGYTVRLMAANSYSGGTVLTNYAKLYMNNAQALGSGGLTLHPNSELNLDTRRITIPWLRGTGGVISDKYAGTGTTTLTVDQNEDSVYAGQINDGSHRTLAITKKGSGSLTLSSANNYTGATTVSGGILGVRGALAETAVSVSAGCGFGAGTTGAVGRATLAGTLTMQDNSHLLVNVGRSDADTISVSGDVTIGDNVELRVSDHAFSAGRWKVIESLNGALTGDFALAKGINAAYLEKSANALWLRIPPKGTTLLIQ